MANRPNGLLAAARSYQYGEAALWLLFALCFAVSLGGESEQAPLLAGVCVLAALGVRATRPAKLEKDADEGGE